MIRARLAPSATRTAISFCRPTRAREQQVGDIRAGNQQDERDGAEQHQQRRPDVLHELILRAGDERANIRDSSPGCSRFELQRDRVHLDPRLLERHAALSRAIGKMPGCQPRSSGSVDAQGPNGNVDVRRLEQLEASAAGLPTMVYGWLSSSSVRPTGLHSANAAREGGADDRDPFGAGTVFRVAEAAAALDVTPSSGSSFAEIILPGTRSGSPAP